VKNITFVGKEVSGVEDAAISDNIKIVVANDYIRISGIKENATASVYSVAGSLMASAVSDEEGNVQVSIENLAKGVYVVALPGHSFKFVK
ncbi:MAG: T9SS type A sorting domain-containing protein, partial [Muribaculaceae bacterium]|nr:T9SS type A sorting domain-containing protein [Muribaculaceae bacterium]